MLKRLTTGAGNEMHASGTPEGSLAFANMESRENIWSLRFDLDHGIAKGALERITQGPGYREYPSLSNNGRYVAFASNQSGGPRNIWIRDLVTGKESSVSSSSFLEAYPVINPSGTRIAFSVYEKDNRVVYVSAPGGTPEKLCEGCLRATDWSSDEKTVLVFGGNPYQINLLDLASHQQTVLLKHPNDHLLYGRFSPDNRWVSFTVRTHPNQVYIAIAPIDGPKPIPESAWITITRAEAEDWANWSPDGKTLYFTSSRDGHKCLWAQRLAAGSYRPVGEPFPVQHFHGRVSYRRGGWSAAGGRIGIGPHGGYGQYLDDVALWRTLNSAERRSQQHAWIVRCLYPVRVCGEAYLAANRGAEAAVEFQKILDYREIVVSDLIGVLAHLARAYASPATRPRVAQIPRLFHPLEGSPPRHPDPEKRQSRVREAVVIAL